MKYIFALLSCLAFECAFAEIIQHIEYQLYHNCGIPKTAAHWVVCNKLESEKGTTIIYIPQGVERQNAKEFFGVNVNHLTSKNDPASIKLELAKNFPNMNLDFCVLEQDKDSITYEWSAQENGIEKIHGFGRAFSDKDSTVVLGYHTEDISNVSQARSIWGQALKMAHYHLKS